VTDEALDTRLPQFGMDDGAEIARFITRYLGLDRARLVR